jgi:hypothetical protein
MIFSSRTQFVLHTSYYEYSNIHTARVTHGDQAVRPNQQDSCIAHRPLPPGRLAPPPAPVRAAAVRPPPISFSRSAYRNVFRVCSVFFAACFRGVAARTQPQDSKPTKKHMMNKHMLHRTGLSAAIMTAREFCPLNPSRRTWVSLEPLNCLCLSPRPRARMHSLSASRLLLISAPASRSR